MRALLPLLLALAVAALPAAPAAAQPAQAPGAGAAFDHEHAAWQRLLEQDVRDGLVDYEALHEDPEALDDYLETLAEVDQGEYTSWTREQRLAFWLNAVNAFTLKAVVDDYPFKRPWWSLKARKFPANSVRQDKGFEQRSFTAAGRELTLAQARQAALQLAPDPRVALSMTCPCLGGPPLPPQAFTPEALESQLDAAARTFVSDPKRVAVVDAKGLVLRLSAALKRPGIGDPLALVRRYLPPEESAALADPGWTIQWQPVDWTLDELGTREAGHGKTKILPASDAADSADASD